MLQDRNADELHGCVGFACVVALGLLLWIGSSIMEANAYNRLTGASVSAWDAMWTDLRVQGMVEK